MANKETNFGGQISINDEPHQRFNSPPPKPPRRRHSDQSSKIYGAANQKKIVSNSSLSSLSSVSKARHCDVKNGSESLPADWVTTCHVNKEMTMDFNNTDNHDFSITDNFGYKSPVPDVSLEIQTSNPSGPSCRDDSLLSFSSSMEPADYSKTCISLPNKCDSSTFHNILLNSNDLGCFNLEEFKFDHELKALLHRHNSDPLLSKSTQSFCYAKNSNSALKIGNAGISNSFVDLSKEFKCPHLFKDSCFISDEARVLKERNDKLWKHMCFLQKKLDTRDSLKENVSVSFSDLMYDIYQTQKDKDIALEKRIKIAAEERDAAVQELEDVLKSITEPYGDNDSSGDEGEQQELKQLFKEIDATQNPIKLLQQQRIFLSCLYHAKETKLNRVSHQLKVTLEEKEHALEKAAKLEEELIKWKSSRCLLHSEAKQWEAGLVEALCQAISQRDSALAKAQCFQEQMKLLRVQLSSCQPKNHSSEETLSSVSPSKGESDEPVTHTHSPKFQEDWRDSKISLNHLETDSDQIRFLKCRVTYLTHQLDCEIKRRQTAEDNCHKLERTISIMRKKLNGINVGVSV